MDEPFTEGIPGGPTMDTTSPAVKERCVEAVAAVGSLKAKLLDVRRQDEWDAGHAAGAVHFELSRLQGGELPAIPKDAEIYVYCAAGKRAGEAARILQENGWTNVVNIGGLIDWQSAGGSVER